MKTECDNCRRDIIKYNLTTYRVSPKGEIPAVFWCEDCLKENGVPVDMEIKEITDIIKEAKQNEH